jgi:hypothetical protein
VRYQVILEEAASCMGGDETLCESEHDDYAAAESRCREIVDARLAELYRPGMTEDRLLELFAAAGEEPFVRPSSASPFVASDYARVRARELVGG